MKDVKVSIIIPIYNPGKVFIKCIESAIAQTLYEIEIILINDGSTDNSIEILDEYSKKDSRIRIFHQENLGAGAARNRGIKNAMGKYVLFLDADDYLENDSCELLYAHAEKLGVDLVLFDNVWHREKDTSSEYFHFNDDEFSKNYKRKIFDFYAVKDKVFSGRFGVIWTKFYKKSFLCSNNIYFPDHRIYNDVEFHIKSLILAKRIAYYPKVFYHYQKVQKDSIQNSYRGKKEAMVFYDVILGIKDFLYEQDLMNVFRIDFVEYSFENFLMKLDEMEENYKNEYFLLIKAFYKFLLLTPDEFEKLNFKDLVYFIHMITSKDYSEFLLQNDFFDVEIFNPNHYSHLNKINSFYDDSSYLDYDLKNSSLKNFNRRKMGDDAFIKDNAIIRRNDFNNLYFYILNLENRLGSIYVSDKIKNDVIKNNEATIKSLNDSIKQKCTDIGSLNQEILKKRGEIKDLKFYINQLELTSNKYDALKEKYNFMNKQNQKLIIENNELKNSFFYKFRKFLR